MFKLRGKLNRSQEFVLGLVGLLLFIAVWWFAAEALSRERPILNNFNTEVSYTTEGINADSLARADSIAYANATEFEKVYPLLPPPPKVLASFHSLIEKDELLANTLKSIWLNLQGYIWAVLIAVPLGFVIGLFPVFRGLFSKHVDAMRYIPLTILTGIFIIWFGIYDRMKVAFLAFGIIVYLMPVVVQRINEVKDVYLKTVFTIGATDWQTIRSVYIPSVMSKLIDDIRVLTAISWTYIIIAELVNREGGIGSLAYIKARQGEIEKVFAILIVIIFIGFLQDRIFAFLDKNLFPHKTYKSFIGGIRESRFGLYGVLIALVIASFITASGMASTNVMMTLGVIGLSALLFAIYGQIMVRKGNVNG
ncbi:MAG: ABC transporter permease subunit [Saprospiraceae bacterium]